MFKKIFFFCIVFFCFFLLRNPLISQDLPKFDVDTKSKGATGTKTAEPGINEFIPVEKQPAIKKKAMPTYPALALSARLEGKAWLKVLVEKDGKPKKAVVIKTDAEVFNDASIDAALRSTYDPAEMNGMNVACWVVVTYEFKIK